jgi:hypothetical protein
MSGVGVQQLFILIFLGMIVKFHVDVLGLEQNDQLCDANGSRRRVAPWKWLTYTLYVVLGLITIRIIFRLVEFSAGTDESTNVLIGTEGYGLGLDAGPMTLALLLLAAIHPSMVLRGPDSEFPSQKEKRLEKKARKARDKSLDAHIQPRGAWTAGRGSCGEVLRWLAPDTLQPLFGNSLMRTFLLLLSVSFHVDEGLSLLCASFGKL